MNVKTKKKAALLGLAAVALALTKEVTQNIEKIKIFGDRTQKSIQEIGSLREKIVLLEEEHSKQAQEIQCLRERTELLENENKNRLGR